MKTPRLIYSPKYNIGFFGLERLHPFDSRKYGRAWRVLQKHFGRRLREFHLRPPRPVSRDELLQVHSAAYLDELRDPQTVARALEVPVVARLPGWVIDRQVLRPMRWAVMGTVLATTEAFEAGLAINLSGGYHHAKPARGEGFSIYADVALAVSTARDRGLLSEQQRVAYIDLDAHQGNGVCHCFLHDSRFFILDMFNSQIYPCADTEAGDRVDCSLGITRNCRESEYLRELKGHLPGFLDSVGGQAPIGLAIYNAGTDVYEEDPLGGLNLSAAGILERDVYVVQELRRRGIPTVMVLSGGYTPVSYRLVADSVVQLIEHELRDRAAAESD